MYLRTVQRKNKDGTVARYIYLAHNQRDLGTGKVQAQILWSFGREEQVDREALRRLADAILRFLDPAQAAASTAEETAALRFRESRSLGGGWVLRSLWEELGCAEAIRKSVRQRSFRVPVEKALFAMVANRALAPASKLAVEEWVREDVALPGVEEVRIHNLYRAMDVLVEAGEALQEEVYHSVAHLLNLEVDLLFLDTTSTYFEVEGEDPEPGEDANYELRRFGHSKDHRPDRAQVVIGLAVTRDGIPVRCWVWPGNTPDVTLVKQVKRDLVRWKLGRVVTVIDRGFTSEENLKDLQRAGGHYIAGERMRSGKDQVEDALSRQGRYHKVNDRVEVKEVLVGEGEARERFILVRNPREAIRDAAQREAHLKKLKEELQALERTPTSVERSKAASRLYAHATYGRYLKWSSKGRLEINQAKVKEEMRLDGKYLLRTSDDTLPPADVALGYKQLLEVEAAFRTLKQVLELRPVYHRLSRRIEAHVLLCWLALLLIRVAEVRAAGAMEDDYTWDVMRRELDRMHLGAFEGDVGTVWQRTETRELQAKLFEALQVKEPPRFFRVDPRQPM